MAARVVVAGSTGATGRSLVALLANSGSEVVALSRREVDTRSAFPNLDSGAAARVSIFKTDMEDPADLHRAISGATAVLSCIGTSRVNEEVKQSMEADPDAGFTEWLQRVDVGYSTALAQAAAVMDSVRFFGRVSARNADPNKEGGGFNLYWKHQGIADEAVKRELQKRMDAGSIRLAILRPGRLDRDEDLRARRPHEVALHEKEGPGLSVHAVARVMLQEMSGSEPYRVVEHDDIVTRGVVMKAEL